MTLLVALLAAAAVIFFLTHPCLDRRRTRRWRGENFAHRGLHDAERGVVENTLNAFRAARDAGYGIELDVQLSADRTLVVFHDDDLRRLCGDPRRVNQVSLEELRALPLKGAEGDPEARIPTFRAALEAVGGRVPLLIELKNGKNNRLLCQGVTDALRDYPGEYIVESFNPLIVAWFRFHAPQVVRGQLVGPMRSYIPIVNQIGAFCMAEMLVNFAGRPDFVAYDANARRFFSPHFQRGIYHTPLAAWTVRDDALLRLVQSRGEICIFERVRP